MGDLYLFCALIVAILIAIFAPRAGVIIGAGLFVLGFGPALWVLASTTLFNVQAGESDGMIITLGFFYLTAPGVMLGIFSFIALVMGWDR